MPPHSPEASEEALRARFDTQVEAFSHGGFRVEVLLPRSADALIDEAEFEADERIPYWAELWPSARALARHLLEAGALPEGPAVELGAGLALPSLALRHRGRNVLATDYYADALRFARANAERNGLAPLRTALLDWRGEAAAPGPFAWALAADVLYERRNAEALSALLPRLLRPGGVFWMADPGRTHLAWFTNRMWEAGWRVRRLAEREEPAPGGASRVRILELRGVG